MKKIRITFFSALILLLLTISSEAEVRLPSMISDKMVLQRDTELKIWGWADPGEALTLKFVGKRYRAKANADGEWEVWLKPMKSGGPYSMEIIASNKITVNDILIGDVWLCAGQSNMEHNLGRHAERYAAEIAASENFHIRQLNVPRAAPMDGSLLDAEMKWEEASAESVLDFTVVGYFFVLKLYQEYGVPQGIIKASVGGTKIESWTSEEGLREFPKLVETIQLNKDTTRVNQINREAVVDRKAKVRKGIFDRGLLNDPMWYEPDYRPLNWKPINVPGYWEDQGIRDLDGVVWYRREVEVPETMTGAEALVKLGRITDADELYINGSYIGKTTYKYPQRRYPVKAGILKPGKNILVVRVENNSGKGGFMPDKPYFLLAGSDTVDLKGTWKYKVGDVFPEVNYKQGIRGQDQPAALYNGMVAPLINHAIRGVVWYQGESNGLQPREYGQLLPAFIQDWRTKWQNPRLPFFIAQLPNYMDVSYSPEESNWAMMREVQLQTALSDPFVGMGINIDLGVWNDVHPGAKKPVGERLALQAMEISYGETQLISSGPICSSYRLEGKRIFLAFDHAGGGLVSGNGEELAHFALAGEDGKFRWAKAEIQGNELVVWCDDISEPVELRYAWADNPDFANLYNKEGLPASPFRIKIEK